MNRWISISTATLAGAALLLGACAKTGVSSHGAVAPAAAEASKSAAPATDVATSPGRPAAGLRMYIDPVTGEAREPTEAELAAEARNNATTSSPTFNGSGTAKAVLRTHETVLPGGLTEVQLDRKADVEEKVCIQPDGSLSGRCPP